MYDFTSECPVTFTFNPKKIALNIWLEIVA